MIALSALLTGCASSGSGISPPAEDAAVVVEETSTDARPFVESGPDTRDSSEPDTAPPPPPPGITCGPAPWKKVAGHVKLVPADGVSIVVAGATIESAHCPGVTIPAAADGAFEYWLTSSKTTADTVTVPGAPPAIQGGYRVSYEVPIDHAYRAFAPEYLARFPGYAPDQPLVLVLSNAIDSVGKCADFTDFAFALEGRPGATSTSYGYDANWLPAPLEGKSWKTVLATITNVGADGVVEVTGSKPGAGCHLTGYAWDTFDIAVATGKVSYIARSMVGSD